MELKITLPPEASRSPNKTMGRSFWVYKKHKDECEKMLLEWESGQAFDVERGSDDNFLGIAKAKFVTREIDVWKMDIKNSEPQVHAHIDGYGCRPKDCDNLVAGCKAIIDVLRQHGYMVDDNPTKMSLSVKSRKVPKKKDERVEITLTTIE